MTLLLIKLTLAHLIGDFFLQPDTWVKAKEERKLKAYPFYFHLFVHAVFTFLLVWDWSFWPYVLTIVLSHGILDAIKLYTQSNETRRRWFFIDQLGHLLVLAGVVFWIERESWASWQEPGIGFWSALTIGMFLTVPASIIIKTVMSRWTPDTEESGSYSLAEAGKYIGILERLFVFVFIVSGRWEAIGFLVAAKSVFRFGDLRQSKDRKLTEYILIGTLLSFAIAIFSGLVYTAIQA